MYPLRIEPAAVTDPLEAVARRRRERAPEVEQFAARRLREVEKQLMDRYRQPLQGDVLELVPDGSRLTEELIARAMSYTGMGPSSGVITICRQVHRSGTFLQGDVRHLESFELGEFTAVVAGRCTIDLMSDKRRGLLLEKVRPLIADDGLLIFSSRNAASEEVAVAPAGKSSGKGSGLGRLFRRNRSELSELPEHEPTDEFMSDETGEQSELRSYIERDAQERQLTETGFVLLECVDLDDRPVPPGDAAAECPELHYVAKPV